MTLVGGTRTHGRVLAFVPRLLGGGGRRQPPTVAGQALSHHESEPRRLYLQALLVRFMENFLFQVWDEFDKLVLGWFQ